MGKVFCKSCYKKKVLPLSWGESQIIDDLLSQGMLTLLSKCIDRMNLYDSAAHFGEMAGEEAGAAWKDILNLLYELLGKDGGAMDHSKYPHLLSALVSCWPRVDARHQSSPTVFAKSFPSSSHFSWRFLCRLFFFFLFFFSLSSFLPLTSINQPHPACCFPASGVHSWW